MAEAKSTVPVKLARFAALSLSKLVNEEKNDRAQLVWSIRGVYPRITVFTSSLPSDKPGFDYDKMLTAPFDYITLQMLFEKMREVIKHDGEISVATECYNSEFVKGVKTGNIAIQSKVVVGKDKNGIIYIMLVVTDKPKIKFNLLPDSRWYKHFDSLGNEITDKAVISKMYATAYVTTLDKLFTSQIANDLTTTKVGKIEEVVTVNSTPAYKEPVKTPVIEKDFELDDFV